ncbi:MAG: hypothetical protein ACLFP1_00955 [Candidatus Goldiibacteriota bacterium]
MKLDCRETEKLIIDFVYDEIQDPGLRAGAAAHINACAACREKAESYGRIKEAAGSMQVDFEPHIWELHKKKIKEKIGRNKTAKKRSILNIFSFIFQPVPAAAVLTIIIAAGAGLYYQGNRQMKTEERAMIEKMEILENMEILERLEFYREMSEVIEAS